jgi:hypothetical protein
MFFEKNNIHIKTSNGFRSFAGVQIVEKQGQITISLCNGKSIKCAPNHRIMTTLGWLPAIDLTHNTIVIGNGFESKVFFIEYKDGKYQYYDIVGVENHEYYANDILSHNCEFLGSSSTLIAGAKLRTLVWRSPAKTDGSLKVYDFPQPTRTYAMAVDTGRGVDGDYSALQVFDVTELPYTNVASYRNKLIDPLIYPSVILNIAKYFNNALVLVETNDIGQQVADILQHDLEYDNLIFSYTSALNGAVVSGGFRGTSHAGVRTTKTVKKLGCSNLKSLVENDKLIISDYETIQELFRFVSNGPSYEASEGNDDLVMCCVLFAWLTDQNYFKELITTNFRRNLYEENIRRIEDELTPFGIVDNGVTIEELPKIVDMNELTENQMSFDGWLAS